VFIHAYILEAQQNGFFPWEVEQAEAAAKLKKVELQSFNMLVNSFI
jgi:hypothetical protein